MQGSVWGWVWTQQGSSSRTSLHSSAAGAGPAPRFSFLNSKVLWHRIQQLYNQPWQTNKQTNEQNNPNPSKKQSKFKKAFLFLPSFLMGSGLPEHSKGLPVPKKIKNKSHASSITRIKLSRRYLRLSQLEHGKGIKGKQSQLQPFAPSNSSPVHTVIFLPYLNLWHFSSSNRVAKRLLYQFMWQCQCESWVQLLGRFGNDQKCFLSAEMVATDGLVFILLSWIRVVWMTTYNVCNSKIQSTFKPSCLKQKIKTQHGKLGDRLVLWSLLDCLIL